MEALLLAGATDSVREVARVTEQAVQDELCWVHKAQRGDTAAFEQLYRKHIDRVYGLCLRMTGNTSEAEDCAQVAFIQAWSKLDKFRVDSAFGTWLHRVAVNVVLGKMRKAHRERDQKRNEMDLSTIPESIDDSGRLQDLEKAVDELPSGARYVFVLHAIYGYNHDETSAMLGIAVGTSKAQLHRARRLLAQRLNDENGAA
ncbi:MAG: RNA polymerase sigma factor [Pseudomonadales bacterium]